MSNNLVLKNCPTSDTWKFAKNCCRTTVNKEFSDKEATDEFKQKLLISEHSPIRMLHFTWLWKSIPYWVSTEWSRHKFEKFITSQRDDRNNNEISRNDKPQASPVDFVGNANMQSLIDVCRKRLCYCASKEARKLALKLKKDLYDAGYKNESNVLVPNCIYRMGCPEFKPCGFFKKFMDWVWEYAKREKTTQDFYDICDIKDRYILYNEYLKESSYGSDSTK